MNNLIYFLPLIAFRAFGRFFSSFLPLIAFRVGVFFPSFLPFIRFWAFGILISCFVFSNQGCVGIVLCWNVHSRHVPFVSPFWVICRIFSLFWNIPWPAPRLPHLAPGRVTYMVAIAFSWYFSPFCGLSSVGLVWPVYPISVERLARGYQHSSTVLT